MTRLLCIAVLHILKELQTQNTHTHIVSHCITLSHSSLARDSQSQAPDSALDAKHEILWFDVPVDNALLQAMARLQDLQPAFFSDPIVIPLIHRRFHHFFNANDAGKSQISRAALE